MSVLRNDFTEGMKKDMYDYFFEKYDAVETVYDQIYDVQPSDAAWEQGTSVIGMGKLRETKENEPIQYRKPAEGYTTYGINKEFTDGFAISANAVEDHQKLDNLVQKIAGTWGESVRATREEYYATTFNVGGFINGHDHFKNIIPGVLSQNTDGLVYDGKPLFNLANNLRRSKGGGLYYNGLSLPLTPQNLQIAYNLMTATNNRNERDEIVAIVPDTLLVHPSLWFTALTILNSTLMPGTANNDANVMAGIVKPIKWHYLTNPNAWFLLKAKNGLVAQNRKEPVIDFFYDEDLRMYKATIRARWGHRVDNWRFVVGSNFATS